MKKSLAEITCAHKIQLHLTIECVVLPKADTADKFPPHNKVMIRAAYLQGVIKGNWDEKSSQKRWNMCGRS